MEFDIDFVDIVTYLLTATGISAWLSAAVNKAYDNKYINFLVKIINVIGGNIWKAKNKD